MIFCVFYQLTTPLDRIGVPLRLQTDGFTYLAVGKTVPFVNGVAYLWLRDKGQKKDQIFSLRKTLKHNNVFSLYEFPQCDFSNDTLVRNKISVVTILAPSCCRDKEFKILKT